MRLFLKTSMFFLVLLSLTAKISDISAQDKPDTEAPIIALSNNNIYAVSPVDSEARLLVERDAAQDDQLNKILVRPILNLSPISPDQTAFAYIAPLYEVLDPTFAADLGQAAFVGLSDVTLVDIASGEQTPITRQAENFAESIAEGGVSTFSHLTWSPAGRYLYFLSTKISLRNRAPQLEIQFYDREAGEYQTLVQLPSQANVVGLYGMTQGLAVLTKNEEGMASNLFEFTQYDYEGNRLNTVEMELPDWVGPTNGTMLTMNPVFEKDDYHFGFYQNGSDSSSLVIMSPATGTIFVPTVLPVPQRYPAFMSRTNPTEPLKVALIDAAGTGDTLWAVVQDGAVVPSMSLKGVVFQSEIALSPDGHQMAFLKPGGTPYAEPVPIMVMDENGKRELDFMANQILWGAIDYTFAVIDAEEE